MGLKGGAAGEEVEVGGGDLLAVIMLVSGINIRIFQHTLSFFFTQDVNLRRETCEHVGWANLTFVNHAPRFSERRRRKSSARSEVMAAVAVFAVKPAAAITRARVSE